MAQLQATQEARFLSILREAENLNSRLASCLRRLENYESALMGVRTNDAKNPCETTSDDIPIANRIFGEIRESLDQCSDIEATLGRLEGDIGKDRANTPMG